MRVLLTVLLLALPALGDSWAAPRETEVFSPSREYFVRITPGESIGETQGFAGGKMGAHARAEFFQRGGNDRSYRFVREIELLHPVAPVDFFVADDGTLFTLDNWHNVGYGDVVAIYNADGKLVRNYRLADLFTAAEIDRMPHSVSSIWWHKGPKYLQPEKKTLYVMIDDKDGLSVEFLTDGTYRFCGGGNLNYKCWTSAATRPRP